MKCIVIETSPERTNAHPVTNENGTPHVYATISEARAELRANGYSYNRANDRYYIKGTECRAYIIRENSEEYAEIIEPEPIQSVNGHTIYKSANDSGEIFFTVRGRIFWTLAEARHYAQCNPTADAERAEIVAELVSDPAARETYLAHAAAHDWSAEETRANIEHANQIKTANRAAFALLDAYADAIGEHPTEYDPETRAAYRVARDEITGTSARATDYDRAIVADMVEDIAARATFEAGRPSAEDIRAKFDSPWLEWEEDASLKTYPDIAAAHAAGASEVVAVITHEDARRAYDLAAEAEAAVPAAHVRKRVDARTAAIDAAISAAARYADAKDAAKHIAGQRVEYLHRHSVNLGTSRYPDHRADYEQYWNDSIILHATASKTGKSIERVPLVFVVLVID